MAEEVEFTYGAFYCGGCRSTFYYRTHLVPGLWDYETFRCPECGGELREVLTN